MTMKPTYEELEQRVKELENEALERKRVEEALRKSEQQYRTLGETIPYGVWLTDAAGYCTYVSNSFLELTDMSLEQIQKFGWLHLLPPETVEPTKEYWLHCVETGEDFKREHQLRAKDGNYRNVLAIGRPIKNDAGKITKWGGINLDITERKQAEEALRESEEKYRSLVESTEDSIYLVDRDGTYLFANKKHLSRLGSPADKIIGRTYGEFHSLDDTKEFVGKLEEVFETGEAIQLDHRSLSDDRYFLRTLSPIKDPGGNTTSVTVVSKDITDRKQAEEEKLKLEALLLQAQKVEAISTLTGGIAHDYNNLLAIIMGNLSMAQEEAEPHSAMAELLHEIEQASYKARDLTHQFLTLSQGGYPRKELGSIESLLKATQGQAQAHEGIEYTLSIQDDLWPVEYDSRQMHFAISNVLTNAVEAMPQGGKIAIEAENQVIENKSKDSALPLKEGKYVRISIKDEGRGIAEKHLNSIFDPYFSTKERGVQKGMGLGLATAYAIVEKHGGHIMVNSTTGVGTTVTIYLPATAAESDAQRAERPELGPQPTIDHQQSAIRSILVMDDEEMLRNLAQKMLERLGYKVETVKDGVEAIETYKKHMDSGEPFDGVILDLTIKGGMGGVQAIKELIKIDPDVKAIVCSGYFNDPVLANHEEHGFRGAMAKPYQMADLEQVLKKVIG